MFALAQCNERLFTDDTLQTQPFGTQSEPFPFNFLFFRIVVISTQMLAEVLLRILQVKLNLRLDHHPNDRVNRRDLRNEVSFRLVETPYPLRLAATEEHSQVRHMVSHKTRCDKRRRCARG